MPYTSPSPLAQRLTERIFQQPSSPKQQANEVLRESFKERLDIDNVEMAALKVIGAMFATAVTGGLFFIFYMIFQAKSVYEVSQQDAADVEFTQAMLGGLEKAVKDCSCFAEELQFDFSYNNERYVCSAWVQDDQLCLKLHNSDQSTMENLKSIENFSHEKFTNTIIALKNFYKADTQRDHDLLLKVAASSIIKDSDDRPTITVSDPSNKLVHFIQNGNDISMSLNDGALHGLTLRNMTLAQLQNNSRLSLLPAQKKQLNELVEKLREATHVFDRAHSLDISDVQSDDRVQEVFAQLGQATIENGQASFSLANNLQVRYTEVRNDILVQVDGITIKRLHGQELHSLQTAVLVKNAIYHVNQLQEEPENDQDPLVWEVFDKIGKQVYQPEWQGSRINFPLQNDATVTYMQVGDDVQVSVNQQVVAKLANCILARLPVVTAAKKYETVMQVQSAVRTVDVLKEPPANDQNPLVHEIFESIAKQVFQPEWQGNRISFKLQNGVTVTYTQHNDDVKIAFDQYYAKRRNSNIATLPIIAVAKQYEHLKQITHLVTIAINNVNDLQAPPAKNKDPLINEIFDKIAKQVYQPEWQGSPISFALQNGVTVTYTEVGDDVQVSVNQQVVATLAGRTLATLAVIVMAKREETFAHVGNALRMVLELQQPPTLDDQDPLVKEIFESIAKQVFQPEWQGDQISFPLQNGVTVTYMQVGDDVQVSFNQQTQGKCALLTKRILAALPFITAAKQYERIKRMQASIRRFNVVRPETPKATVNALHDSIGKAFAYQLKKEGFGYVKKPQQLPYSDIKGGFKHVSHADEENGQFIGEFITLTIDDPNETTTYPEIVQVIEDYQLDSMVLAHPINDTQLMTPNLGKKTLRRLLEWNEYQYDPQHFARLAWHLDTFHAQECAHGDIKPGNMFFDQKRNCIVLIDHDGACKVGRSKPGGYTPHYVPQAYLDKGISYYNTEKDKTVQYNLFKQDQYAFFISMMESKLCEGAQKGGTFNNHAKKVERFVNSLPCNPDRKYQLKGFLCDPVNCYLPYGLVEYITPTASKQNVIDFIRTNNLVCIVPQLKLSDQPLPSPALSPLNNLLNLRYTRQYQYQPGNFKELAGEIDVLHKSQLFHRNIKPQKMYWADGRVVLYADYCAGHAATEGGWTPNYRPETYQHYYANNIERGDATHDINLYKCDQYALLVSMMQIQFDETPSHGQFGSHQKRVEEFVTQLPCDDNMKKEVSSFLIWPETHKLTRNLADYL